MWKHTMNIQTLSVPVLWETSGRRLHSHCPGNFSVTFCSVESYFLHHAKQNAPNWSGSLQQFGKMFVIYHAHFFYWCCRPGEASVYSPAGKISLFGQELQRDTKVLPWTIALHWKALCTIMAIHYRCHDKFMMSLKQIVHRSKHFTNWDLSVGKA